MKILTKRKYGILFKVMNSIYVQWNMTRQQKERDYPYRQQHRGNSHGLCECQIHYTLCDFILGHSGKRKAFTDGEETSGYQGLKM